MARPAVLEEDPAEWRKAAVEYIADRARRVGTVSADDVRRDLPAPHHHNQYGIAFGIASGRKLIEKADSGPSPIRSRRGGDRKVWRLHPEQLTGAAR